MRRVAATAALALLCSGCFLGTEDPKAGFPVPTVEFPPTAAPGSVQEAVLHVRNPGSEDIKALLVTFVAASPAAAGEPLPNPIVSGGPGGDDPAVRSIEPEPEATDDLGVVYRFGPLAAEAETTIRFRLAVPTERGPAGNSVLVADGEDPQRARGVRVQTEVGG